MTLFEYLEAVERDLFALSEDWERMPTDEEIEEVMVRHGPQEGIGAKNRLKKSTVKMWLECATDDPEATRKGRKEFAEWQRERAARKA